MRLSRVLHALAVAWGLVIAGAPLPLQAQSVGADRPLPWGELHPEPVEILTRDGRSYPFKVEIAWTDPDWSRGLMFRDSMPLDQGMLFTGQLPRQHSFWMRNTLIPLDIIFIGTDGRILNIHANAEPRTETPRPSQGVAAAVLELNGGTARRLRLGPGDEVRHPLLHRPGM